jgi:drug/metabolite transporter (DMT)-like permease
MIEDRHSSPQDQRMLGLVMRLGSVAGFSTMALFVKLASERGVRLPEIMFWRQFAAIPVVMLWAWIGPGLASLKTERFGAHARRALLGTTGMFFTLGGVVLLPLAEVTTISFTVPIFSTILGAVILKEAVGIHRWSAVVIGFVGMLIMIQPGSGSFPLKGALAALTGAMMVAVIGTQLRDLGRTEAPTTTAFYFSLLASIILGVLNLMPMPGAAKEALAWGAGGHDFTLWLVIVMTGVAGGIGQIMLTGSLRYAPISTVVGMDYTGLIWSTLYGWLIWKILPGPWTWVGAPIIIASGLYIAWREHRLSVERVGDVVI